MKIFIIFPFILTTLSSFLSRINSSPFEYISFTPLYKGKESSAVIDVKSNSWVQINVFLVNDIYSSQEILNTRITGPGTYTYKYDNRYTRTNNQLYLTYSSSSRSGTSSLITMNVARNNSSYIYEDCVIESDNFVSTFTKNMTWETRKCNYSFTNFTGFCVSDYYHKIDLASFQIGMSDLDKYLFKMKGSLLLRNYNGVFDDIDGSDSHVLFDLKYENGSIALKNDLYVHPETLLMSSTPKDGYVQTHYIYLPRNEMRSLDKYEAYMYFTDFGIDNDMIVHPFEIRALKNTVGDCHNSKYCVQRL